MEILILKIRVLFLLWGITAEGREESLKQELYGIENIATFRRENGSVCFIVFKKMFETFAKYSPTETP